MLTNSGRGVAQVGLGCGREGRGIYPGVPAALLPMRQAGKRIITIRQEDNCVIARLCKNLPSGQCLTLSLCFSSQG